MGKVLVIDNDHFMLEVIEAVLELAGRRTLGATSGEEGVAHFRNQREDIDLVILDMRLSTAMEGADALRALRAIDPAVKVIIASAYSEREVEDRLVDQRWDAILRKPYNMEQLLVTIEELNASRRDAAPSRKTVGDASVSNAGNDGANGGAQGSSHGAASGSNESPRSTYEPKNLKWVGKGTSPGAVLPG